jgi:hypothetical protein
MASDPPSVVGRKFERTSKPLILRAGDGKRARESSLGQMAVACLSRTSVFAPFPRVMEFYLEWPVVSSRLRFFDIRTSSVSWPTSFFALIERLLAFR